MRRFLIGLLGACLAVMPVTGAQVPRPAPDLSFFLPSGKVIELEKYKGRVIALEFLLTTCPHCQRTSQLMQKLYQEYEGRGFQPLGVAINDGAQKLVPAYVKEYRVTFPIGVGDRNMAVSFLQHPVMMQLMMPQLVFIDRAGRIRAQYPGTDPFFRNEEVNVRKVLDELLAEER